MRRAISWLRSILVPTASWLCAALVTLLGGNLLVERFAVGLAEADARQTVLAWASDLEGRLWDDLPRLLQGERLSARGLDSLARATQFGGIVSFRVFDKAGDAVFASDAFAEIPIKAPLGAHQGETVAARVLAGDQVTVLVHREPPLTPAVHVQAFQPIRRGNAVIGVFLVTLDQTERHNLFRYRFAQLQVALQVLILMAALPPLLFGLWRGRQRRAAEERVRFLAHHDPLTGLSNRERFRAMLEERLVAGAAYDGSFALFAIDLDGFKAVNDGFGHAAGDEVLVLVGKRLRNGLRADDLPARLGGDEFAVLLPQPPRAEHLAELAERLIEALSDPYHLADGRIARCGASIGITEAATRSVTAEALLGEADMALYAAKAEGRGCAVRFRPGMDETLRARLTRIAELREAIEQGRIEVAFQPQFRLSDRSLVGFEALARWPRPDLPAGSIGPAEFIPLAEETGLILPLGLRILRVALDAARLWPEEIGISVNLSPRQIRAPRLVEDVEAELRSAGVAPSRLTLEVTESMLIGEPEQVMACMARLQAIGVRIAMDDFGTGHSSLSNLWRFPFDGLKIDKSFILRIGEDPKAAAIIDTIVGLGASLGLTVTAEGVENAAQARELDTLGCAHVQGFMLGRPVSAEAATRLAVEPGAAEHHAAA